MENKRAHPPRLANRFLKWYCHPDLLEEIEGDILEDFYYNIQQYGLKRANWIFTIQVLLFFRLSNIKKITLNFSFIMWRNYMTISLRNMLKYKGFTLLNILGLTIGLTTALLILLWIQDEVSYDKYHENDPYLYRVMRNMHLDAGEIVTTGSVPFPLEAELKNNFPEVESVNVFSWEEEMVVSLADKAFREAGRFVGDDFFLTHTHPFIVGDAKTALQGNSSVIISDQLAQKLFGKNWLAEKTIIGEGLKIGIDSFSTFTIQGVFEDIPANSTFRYCTAYCRL